ncbi:MAG: hypothetical protein DRP01_03525 [Archaeoglobales archaeon]|nr:MAG: hypothetical protein DRP01_03525 [Archaeoglobales archaeon]
MIELKEIIKEIQEIKYLLRSQTWPRWLPTKLAAKYSGLSANKLRQLYKEGEIYAKDIGGKLIFDRESIDEYFLKDKAKLKIYLDKIKSPSLC